MSSAKEAIVQAVEKELGLVFLTVTGRLDSETTGPAWSKATSIFKETSPKQMIVDASGVDYCDISGIALLADLRRRLQKSDGTFEVRGLKAEFQRLFDLFEPSFFEAHKTPKPQDIELPEEVGEFAYRLWGGIRALISFIGEAGMGLLNAFLKPRSVRWKDTFSVAERAGVDALPIVVLISFLIGLIMAFQSAIPMRQFGAEIYVANLIGLSMVRELGPLMTAIILAGRSGSAFAAELGTMKVNEELDALITMGLDPMRFLAVPRLIAALMVTPLLSVFADFVGVAGGSIVLMALGYPMVTYVNQVLSAVTTIDFLGGIFKSLAFGLLIAGVGCLRGLQTKTGPTAVGESTTSAVVGGIILIVVADGVFSVMFFYLGI
jgi:phospholipid/cholesterol/gamma-HCH transport system permease protein